MALDWMNTKAYERTEIDMDLTHEPFIEQNVVGRYYFQ